MDLVGVKNNMKKYKTKSKMFGYKIGLLNDNLYVAVPKKYFINDQAVEIECDGEKNIVMESDKQAETTQLDKFGKGMTYTLYYFMWKEF